MNEGTAQVSVTLTCHRTDADQYHVWVRDKDKAPDVFFDDIERIEAEFFRADREAGGLLTERLPVEGEYEHSPIEIGEAIYSSNGEIIDIQIDVETAIDKLRSHEYLGFC